ITLTINDEILNKVDQLIDGINIRNRSHAIEWILSKYLNFKELKTAIILCGGKGTRLRPITYEIPKPLVPVHGKPIIEHIFDLFRKYGIIDIILSVGYLKDRIIKEVDNWSRLGINITVVEEDKPLGTAGPLRLAKDKLKKTFIVSNGDELKDVNILEMYEVHKKNKALGTVALTTVSDPSQYGVVKLEGNKIVEFVEKPEKGKFSSNLINAGLCILEPKIIDLIPDGFCSLERDIFPKLVEQGKLYGFPFSGQWFDTGNFERYEKALKEWKDIRIE
ncbi:MAG: nucleotidyltransferase family protein, partial [Candidatus Aenigmarchaeota archaeon]|nr:nucleotidyltransferase family protein [Candidatus Aenigmarchaeota archaeon]